MPSVEVVKVLVSIMMSVSLSNKGKPLKLRHYDINRAHFQGTVQTLIHVRVPAGIVRNLEVGRLVKSMYGTQDASHIWQLDYVNLISRHLGSFRVGKHSEAWFHNPNQDVRMTVHGDDFVFVKRWWTQTHRQFSQLQIHFEDRTLGFENSDAKILLLLNRLLRVGVDQSEQYLDIEPDLEHAPLMISESGCKMNESGEHTTRQTTRQTGVERKTEPDSEYRWRKKTQIYSYETVILGPRQIRSVWNSDIWPRMSEPREFDFVRLKRVARYLSGGKAQVSAEITNTETCWQEHSLRGQRFCWRTSLEEEHNGFGDSDR